MPRVIGLLCFVRCWWNTGLAATKARVELTSFIPFAAAQGRSQESSAVEDVLHPYTRDEAGYCLRDVIPSEFVGVFGLADRPSRGMANMMDRHRRIGLVH